MKKLGLGMMRLPLLDENDYSSIDFEHVNNMVDEYMSAGFNYFDTGYPYHEGLSEVALRKCLVERYPRKSFNIADKLPLFSITKESQLEEIFQEQLDRCGVDYFDYYLMHNVSSFSEAGWIGVDSFSFVSRKKEEGFIKHLGFSCHANAEFLEMILKQHPEMEFVQLQINYLDWENEGIEARKCWQVACKYKKPIIIMEALKGGFLADVPKKAEQIMKKYNSSSSVVSWAMRFVMSLDNVCMVLTGASNLKQLKENISDIENFTPLTDEEYVIIDKVREIINSQITVDCTKCKYCVDSCAENINIPKLFDLYNNEKIENHDGWTAVGNEYRNYSKLPNIGIASDCIECGLCVEECPQHINIPDVLKDVKKTFETETYGFEN